MTARLGGRRLVAVLPWLVVGVVMLALASVAVVRLFVDDADRPADADTVREVANMAVVISESLDVEGGLGLLCAEPISLYRMAVESTIERWSVLVGPPGPEVRARVSQIDDGPVGSFLLRIDSEQDALRDERRTFRVFVDSQDGRSCVVGIGGRKADRATILFDRSGYSDVTTPTPTTADEPVSR